MKACIALIGCFLSLTATAEVLVPERSSWQYRKGTSEPSSPVSAWRQVNFNDSPWSSGSSPFYYGESLGSGTVLSDMRGNYTTVYLRRYFNVFNPEAVDRLALRVLIDDGYIAWINGREVARFNVSVAEQPYSGVARATIERTWTTNSLASPSQYLLNGANVIAVQVFNRELDSTDLVFDLELQSTTDNAPPTIKELNPPPGKVSEFNFLTVTFSEPVQGVFAGDLLINNNPAENVSGSGATYTYTFPQPDFGPVDITFDAGQRIIDFADPPHPFDANGYRAEYDLDDDTVPFVEAVVPPPGVAVRHLSSVEVQFSETVLGVEAGDLLINGMAATNLQVLPGERFLFEFPPQPEGAVNISWAPEHQIHDLATNSLVAEGWAYDVNPALPNAQVVITEFLAAAENTTGLQDEDGELQDWIELHNIGATMVNLAGWGLTDDPDEPGLWTFPDVTLAAGERLVVFASGKDRKPTTAEGRLHTNFKLSNSGEYLALFNSDSPRVAMTEFQNDYPEQRNDYSYGVDPTGVWRYYQVPTPGQPNGTSSIVGIVPKPGVNQERGWYDAPFTLELTNVFAGTTIRYTTDGSVPTESSGAIYSGPILVSSNLVLRAIAYRQNHLPSEVLTHTYLFADHVLRQPNDPAGFPVGPTVQAGYPSDYEMDPEIVNDPQYASQMKDALFALPIMAISIKMDDMFGAENGIYTHPTRRGVAWERPCSVEFMPVSGDDFQVDAGIQIQGNAARDPQKQPKHPFRVVFKGDYGPKKLDYRMFPDSPVTSFDTLILRADFNYTWLHWNPVQRIRAQRTRDAWVKDTMRAMGGLASHNRYVHLFINGVYWGIYDPTERPDGSFGEAYLGGDKEDYDVMNEGAVVDGSRATYDAMLAMTDLTSTAQYDAMKAYLDMPQFIDYMLLHFYLGHEDWFNNKNWYAIRPKDGSRGFLYIPWDGEMVLGNLDQNRVSTTDLPSRLHPNLLAIEQYRMDFGDRVHRHFFNAGALTPAENSARWQKRAREMELPIIAESARWGDYRRDVHQYSNPPYELYEREVQYRAEQNRLLNDYFPNRTSVVLDQLRAAGLYPTVAAPAFNQHGGKIEPGFELTINAAAGTIYYTTNGVDPRVYGTGAIASDAQIYTAAVILPSSVHVKTRVHSGGKWSALTEATFTTESPRVPLRITELMYHPNAPGDAYEFIEVQNFSPLTFDATGFFIRGVDYIFPPQSILAPGQIIVLASAENPARFAEQYPNVQVFGTFGGRLVNSGERVALVAANGQTVQSVDYDDDSGWPEAADGDGFSLEVKDPVGNPDDPANWQSSTSIGGTPGATNSQHAVPAVIINEVYASGSPDWVEFRNTTDTALNLAGWSFQEAGNTNVLTFGESVNIPPGGYWIVYCDTTSTEGDVTQFGLGREGETLILRNASGAIVDVLMYGPQVPGRTIGKIDGKLQLAVPSPGESNIPAPLGSAASLVINEWLADAAPGQSDWFELHNTDMELPVALRGLFLSVSNQLFEISGAAFAAPGGYVQLFADELPEPDSVDFKLPAGGATIELLDEVGRHLTAVSYGAQEENISQGWYPDATDNMMSFPITPSPGAPNQLRFPMTVSASGGEILLSWPSVAARSYRIEISNDLSTWTELREVIAPGGTTTAGESASEKSRYFRVIALP